MSRINYSKLLIDGRRIQARHGEALLKQHHAGDLILTTGKIVACDPAVAPETPPFSISVRPDKYPVILSIADFGHDQRVAYAMLRFSDERPARWEAARLSAKNYTSFNDDEADYYGVDSATGCFMDVEAAQVLVANISDDAYFERIAEEMDKTYVHTWAWANIRLDSSSEANLICFSTGVGDGAYASCFGLSDDGRPLSLVTDFDLFDEKELHQWLY